VDHSETLADPPLSGVEHSPLPASPRTLCAAAPGRSETLHGAWSCLLMSFLSPQQDVWLQTHSG